ncbi:MAG: hypothetical protein OEZ10_13830, partial [Gammaproteobacteria bacterium]|nr:hypothetical protein [Gammaproteobacteria bacterium]
MEYHFRMTNKLTVLVIFGLLLCIYIATREYGVDVGHLKLMQKHFSQIGVVVGPIAILVLLARKSKTGDFVINQKGVIDEASDVRIGFIPWEHIERICVSHSAPYFMKHFRLF